MMTGEETSYTSELGRLAVDLFIFLVSYVFVTALTMLLLVRLSLVFSGDYGILEMVRIFVTGSTPSGTAIVSGFMGSFRQGLFYLGFTAIVKYPANVQIAIMSAIVAFPPWLLFYAVKTQYHWRGKR